MAVETRRAVVAEAIVVRGGVVEPTPPLDRNTLRQCKGVETGQKKPLGDQAILYPRSIASTGMNDKGKAIEGRHPIGPGVRALNPGLFGAVALSPACVAAEKRTDNDRKGKPQARAEMNKTERDYSLILEAMKRRGDIVDWEREGITLRWPDGMRYTPDFTVTLHAIKWGAAERDYVSILFIEAKGPRIEDDAMVKFRAARDKWTRYRFEMWQRRYSRGSFEKIL